MTPNIDWNSLPRVRSPLSLNKYVVVWKLSEATESDDPEEIRQERREAGQYPK